MRRLLFFLAAIMLLATCGLAIGLALLTFPAIAREPEPASTSTPVSVAQKTATITPQVIISPVSTSAAGTFTLDQLQESDVQRNDPIQLHTRLKGNGGVIATPAAPVIFRVGDQTSFWISRQITGTYELISATLRYVTPHSDLWVENGETFSDVDLRTAGDTFENKIYPTDRRYFGSEPTPGIDNDPHIFILNTHFSGALGYFSSADTYPTFVNRYSNRHEMFYMNARQLQPGTDSYTSVLAHEFTHMIHWNQNKHEGSWITEGFGDLAMQLNGFPQDPRAFVRQPDIQLNAWAGAGGGQIPHYIAAYLFLAYSLNRFGDGLIRDIVQSGTHDIASIQQALDKQAPGVTFDEVFADWTIANYVDNVAPGEIYQYPEGSLHLRPQNQFSQYPANLTGSVHQYGTEYVELNPHGADASITFDGSTRVKVVPTDAHSGKMVWWSNRVDQSDTLLTRSFDLTHVKKATLNFWTWYDIESDFDYAYIEASPDGGKSWKTLAGRSTTNRDPNGANYGNGLSCKSGGTCDGNSPSPQWIQEQIDLTPYAGQKILLRFEYVTDAIYAGPGLIIDDISIPEIGFSDDAEQSDNGWQAQGFARIDNSLPQHFIVQAIEYGANGQPTRVVPISLDAANHGSLKLSGFGRDISRVVLAISGNTPITWEEATYKLNVQ